MRGLKEKEKVFGSVGLYGVAEDESEIELIEK